jgi:hypothetical protein
MKLVLPIKIQQEILECCFAINITLKAKLQKNPKNTKNKYHGHEEMASYMILSLCPLFISITSFSPCPYTRFIRENVTTEIS